MDIFRVLTRGAAINKKGDDIRKGNSVDYSKGDANKDKPSEREEHQMTKELDFFRNKKIVLKVEDIKKRESEEQDDEEDKDENDENTRETEEIIYNPKITNKEEASTLRKSYKGNITGDDVPLPIGSFEDLITRFSFDKRLLNNLI